MTKPLPALLLPPLPANFTAQTKTQNSDQNPALLSASSFVPEHKRIIIEKLRHHTRFVQAKSTEDQVRHIHELRMAGMRPADIARKVGLNCSTVKGYLYGLTFEDIKREFPEYPVLRRSYTQEDRDEVLELKRSGKSVKEISALTGIATSTIYAFLKEGGL